MRAVIQRVSQAEVRVEGEVVTAIGPGLLVLLGVAPGDTDEDADRVAAKIAKLRIFPGPGGAFDMPVGEREVLVVSQFTLLGDTRGGNRPSWSGAGPPEHAEPLYERVRAALGAQGGAFGAHMEVELVNDGPVTLLLDT